MIREWTAPGTSGTEPPPRIERSTEPLDALRIVKLLRALEQEPWVCNVDPELGTPAAIEASVGIPAIRIRVDLAGDLRGNVRVFVAVSDKSRARLAMFPSVSYCPIGETPPPMTIEDTEHAVRVALGFIRELGADILAATRSLHKAPCRCG